MRFVVAVMLLVAACKKGDPVKCEAACRNYAQLDFWHGADQRINALPEDQREAARKQELATFEKNLSLGIDTCTSKCVDANYDKDVSCWTNAKTYEQLQKCKE